MAGKYFGTDGIRGPVDSEILGPDFLYRLGWAAGRILAGYSTQPVLIGRDTRQSGPQIQDALVRGLLSSGARVMDIGVLPTPAVSYMTRELNAAAGIVITASHNPASDNGVKFFVSGGMKPDDDTEHMIELLVDQSPVVETGNNQTGHISDAADRYLEFCLSSVPGIVSMDGMHVALDCANGAVSGIAPALFERLACRTSCTGIEPDGLNINQDCGATSMQSLRNLVMQSGADLGIAFDGDADRILMLDHNGTLINGDQILYICAGLRMRHNIMRGAVVGTQMSNLGLERAVTAMGLSFVREAVGDRYVIQRLVNDGGVLGGESSGHIINLDISKTGDALVAALLVIQAMQESGRDLAELVAGMELVPQVLINVPVRPGRVGAVMREMEALVTSAQQGLADAGRILLRASGTEPLIRVMVEGDDEKQIAALASDLATQAGQMEKRVENPK